MPDVTLILQRRHRRQRAQQHNPAGRLGLALILAISLFAAAASFLLVVIYGAVTRDLPAPEMLPALLSPATGDYLEPTRVYDRTGQHLLLALENPAVSGRSYRQISGDAATGIPDEVIRSTLAAVDPQFWQHPGFTYSSLINTETPTIARRLVADILLWDEPAGLRRQVREYLLAAQITTRFGREQVLEWYLNSANYGRLAYGVENAAQVYFGKSAADLDLAEAAVLAAILDAPAINPLDTRQASLARQDDLLQQMVGQGVITNAEAAAARQTRLEFQPPAPAQRQLAPEFVQQALRELAETFGWARLERCGLNIITTLDYDLQKQTSCVLEAHLRRVSGQADLPQTLEDCPAVRDLPTLALNEHLQADTLAANAALYDPQTGEILALAVSAPVDMETALSSGRPPGTLLTPFVYLTGFTRGQSPASLVWDIPGGPDSPQAQAPVLDEGYQGPLRLRNALANDDLSPAVQALFQSGVENFWRITRQLGLDALQSADLPASYQVLWEGGQANLLEMLQAYGTIANQGVLVGRAVNPAATPGADTIDPVLVLQVTDAQGSTLLEQSVKDFRPVVSQQLAYLLTDVLSDEAARWRTLSHPNPLEISRPAAAKLGQTAAGLDGWALGYTPELAAGVWLGSSQPDPENLPLASAALWYAIIQYASRELPANDWPVPAGISTMSVCDPSGQLPTPNCPTVVSEVFVNGSEPTQPDNLFQNLKINRESGLLATVDTPPELVEERVYLVVPPAAQEWARQAGLPTPPEDYDVFLTAGQSNENIAITSPTPFAYLRDRVTITGTATGPDFAYYRLQVGQGLNPQTWLQVGSDQQVAVRNGVLGEWDTRGLDGLYVIQLVKVSEDQRIETTSQQVTVDNQPPQGVVRSPEAGQVFQYPLEKPLSFQVTAEDNLGIEQVEFLVDGRHLAFVDQAPYATSWQGQPGAYTLTVRITDLAGNQATLLQEFAVSR
jgi:membrane peptidoglycan carboxypeptidase